MADPEYYRDRRRAEGFGDTAEDYDRHRPPYADALFDELAALRPDRVLDVGCGNGRAAAGLVSRGLDVLGVEPDERMAAVARWRGIAVEIAPFEDWDDAGRHFDLVVCGSAWHWVEPVRGTAKVAAVLRPGGTFARFWNYQVVDGAALERLEQVYAEHAPEATPHGRAPDSRFDDRVAADPAFGDVTTSIGSDEAAYSADAWIDLLATFSDHRTMDPDRRAGLFRALRAVIDDLGGTLRATSCTHVLWSVRV